MSISFPIVAPIIALVLSTAPAGPHYLPTKVEVDVDPLVEGSPADDLRLERIVSDSRGVEVLKQLTAELESHGVPVDGEDPRITIDVRLEWKVYLDSHYLIQIVVRGEDGSESTTELECILCDEPKLAATIAQRAPDLLPLLEVVNTTSVGEHHADPTPPESTQGGREGEPETVGTSTAEVRRVGAAGWAGIGLGALGVGGIVGGAVYLRRGVEQVLSDNVALDWNDDYRPFGGALVGVGGLFVVGSVVLIALDQTVFKKRREERGREASVGASLFPQRMGIAVTGRF